MFVWVIHIGSRATEKYTERQREERHRHKQSANLDKQREAEKENGIEPATVWI